MAKWEKLFFKLHRGTDKERLVSGMAYRGLALLKRNGQRETWSLTHIRSGQSVISITGSLQDVRRVGASIAELVDWGEFETGEQIVAANPSIEAKILAIMDFEEGNHATVGAA